MNPQLQKSPSVTTPSRAKTPAPSAPNTRASSPAPSGQQPSSTTQDSPSPFFTLAPELRIEIYKLLLTAPSSSVPSVTKAELADPKRQNPRNPYTTFVLRATSITTYLNSKDHHHYKNTTSPLHPSLLLTCRLINTEATPFLYTLNTFVAHHALLTTLPSLYLPSVPHSYITNRIYHSPHLSLIRKWHITIRLDIDARFTTTSATLAFSGAQELTIETSETMFRSAGCDVLLAFSGVRDVGKACVRGSVEKGFARWLENCMMSAAGSEVEGFVGDRVEVGGRDVWMSGNR